MPLVHRHKSLPVRMVFRQERQRLGVSERRESVSASPVVGHGSAMPEQPVVLLDVRAKQEISLYLQKRLVSRQRVSPAQQRAGHEHVLGAIVGIAGRRRSAKIVDPIKLRRRDQEVAVSRVAGRLEHLVAPDQTCVSRPSRRLVVPRLLSRQIRRYQVGYAVGVCGYFARKRAESEPAAERDALGVYDRIERIAVSRRERLADLSRGSSAPTGQILPGRGDYGCLFRHQARQQAVDLFGNLRCGSRQSQALHLPETVRQIGRQRRQQTVVVSHSRGIHRAGDRRLDAGMFP